MAKTFLFGELIGGREMGEMAGTAAALGDGGKFHFENEAGLPRALGKGHSSLPSSPSILAPSHYGVSGRREALGASGWGEGQGKPHSWSVNDLWAGQERSPQTS